MPQTKDRHTTHTHTKVCLSVCSQNRERPKHMKPIYSDSAVGRQMFEACVTSACLSGEILSGPLKIQSLKKREWELKYILPCDWLGAGVWSLPAGWRSETEKHLHHRTAAKSQRDGNRLWAFVTFLHVNFNHLQLFLWFHSTVFSNPTTCATLTDDSVTAFKPN